MGFTTENKITQIQNNHTKQVFEVVTVNSDHFVVKETTGRGRNAEPFNFYFDEVFDSFRNGGISVEGIADIDALFIELRQCAVRAELEHEKEQHRRDIAAIRDIQSLNQTEED